MTFDELINNITQWADDKGILFRENAPQQSMKVMEELGETMGAILKGKKTDDSDSSDSDSEDEEPVVKAKPPAKKSKGKKVSA